MPRVLLVDDDIAEISAVKRVLARAGHQALLATNAADALAAVGKSAPAVVVVASTCEGGDALRRLAEDVAAAALPLVVLGESPFAPERASQVARPIDPAQLADQLAAALRAAASAPIADVPPVDAAPPAPPPAAPARRPATAQRPAAAGPRASARPAGSGPAAARPAAPAAAAARPTGDRRAAADALRARAEELRRAAGPRAPAPAADPAIDATASADAALAELAAAAAPPLDLELDPGLEAILQRAEQAEAREREGARARARAEAERAAGDEARKVAEEQARREIEEATRRADEEARSAAEEQARREIEEATRRANEEARRAAEENARREIEEATRRAERDAKRGGGDEEDALRAAIRSARDEMEALRRKSGAEEEHLRAAIESARAEMEALRKSGEEETRRRTEAEAEVARLAREAAVAAARPSPLEVPIYRPPAEDPAPDPAQESARRRVAALRERPAATPPPAGAPDEPARPPIRAPPPELRSGTLADLPAPRLLALAARAELGGRIDVEGDASRSLWFAGGRLVGAASSAPSERVEEVALRLGLVTRDQHRLVAASAAPLATRRAALVLLERGFLKPAELGPLVRRRTEEVVFGIFAEAGARFRWSAGEVPPDESTALERSALELAVEGVRRRWLGPEVEAVLGGDATLLAPVSTGPDAADLGLSAAERRVLALADGLRTLDELVGASPLDPLSTRQALAALVLVGALAVRTFQGGRPAAAASAAIDLARVRDKLDQVRRADYFTVLGVGRLCTPHEIRAAFDRLRAEFDPRRFQGVREDGLEGRLEEIQRVVADARDVLADDRLRTEYLRGLGE